MSEEISLCGMTTMVRIINVIWINNVSYYVVSLGEVTQLAMLIRNSTSRGCATSSENKRAAKKVR